jgi:hypothetical protein
MDVTKPYKFIGFGAMGLSGDDRASKFAQVYGSGSRRGFACRGRLPWPEPSKDCLPQPGSNKTFLSSKTNRILKQSNKSFGEDPGGDEYQEKTENLVRACAAHHFSAVSKDSSSPRSSTNDLFSVEQVFCVLC